MSSGSRRTVALIAIVAAALGSISATADAAKGGRGQGGGGKGDSSFTLVNMTDDVLSHGDSVSFDVATTATDRPYVWLTCVQDGRMVVHGAVGYFDEFPLVQYFVLDSYDWVDGGADCDAELTKLGRNHRHQTLASMSFSVAP